jgi:enoyl-CoA hydratase
MKDFQTFRFEEVEPRVGLVTMNRPEQLNAVNIAMLDDFGELFSILSKDDAIRVLILTGEGRGFCAGADLNDAVVHKDTDAFSDPANFLRIVQERYGSLVLGLRRIPQPVISAVNGPAAGAGFCMTLASDVRVASPEASFIASFANIGLTGGELGTSYFLPRLIGTARSSEILLTGRKVKADEAERIGLVNRVVPREPSWRRPCPMRVHDRQVRGGAEADEARPGPECRRFVPGGGGQSGEPEPGDHGLLRRVFQAGPAVLQGRRERLIRRRIDGMRGRGGLDPLGRASFFTGRSMSPVPRTGYRTPGAAGRARRGPWSR